jgi:predicted TIM-barrel fold metal-dependent hydrolase
MRCDSHVHVVGPIDRYPQLQARAHPAPPAPLQRLCALGAACGIERFVIVQPSFYGTDNRLVLESLDALDGRGRGVAVVDPATVPQAELRDYAARGVRGLRLNLYSPVGNVDRGRLPAAFAAAAAIAEPLGWHVQVIAAIEILVEHADLLGRSAVPIVIDHYGVYGRHSPTGAAGKALLDLLRRPHVWVKLSAPYRVSDDPLATKPDPAWLAAFLDAARDRCVWGSDWPHTQPHGPQADVATATGYRPIAYATLVDDFVAALGSAELSDMIMRDNPARLYGF